jgi:nitrite reductase/ring-hydroxylating ferredoxin subunit
MMNRRNALLRILAGGATVLYLDNYLLRGEQGAPLVSELRLSLTDPRFAALANINGTAEITNSIAPGIQSVLPSGLPLALVRSSTSVITAASMECPHNQCKVNTYNGSQFVCPCHASRFTGAGARVSGPTPRGLTTYPVVFDALAVTVSGLPGSQQWNLTDATDPVAASAIALQQNEPNPFRGSTNIGFALGLSVGVRLEVHDESGRHIATMVDGHFEAGQHTVRFDASALTAGVYFYTLHAGRYTESKRMVLLP